MAAAVTAVKPEGPATSSIPAAPVTVRPPVEPSELRVTSFRATVKAGRVGWVVAWLPSEGWFCECGQRRCEHIRATRDAVGR